MLADSHLSTQSMLAKFPKRERRAHKYSPLGNIARLASSEIESISITPSSSTFDTGNGNVIGYTDDNGKVILTVAVHGEDLFDRSKNARLLRRDGGFIHDSQDCKTFTIEISSPLLRLGTASDKLDVSNGIVYRETGRITIDNETQIREVSYCGVRCFRIDLPAPVSDICLSGVRSTASIEELGTHEDGIFLSHDKKCAYVYLKENVTLGEAENYLTGKEILYTLEKAREEILEDCIKNHTHSGARYIEICTDATPKFLIIYKKRSNVCTQK